MKIYVKNMICESCKIVVQNALEQLNVPTVRVDLGEIETKVDVSDAVKLAFNNKIRQAGLELVEKKDETLIGEIKKTAIEYVFYSEEKPNIKFSVLLSNKLNYSYRYLSNFFAKVETTTIEQFIISLKVQKIKELIMFGDDNFSEIAYKLHYSSIAHLSNQFKKVTGLTPSHFKELKEKRRVA